MTSSQPSSTTTNRRAFVRDGSLFLLGGLAAGACPTELLANDNRAQPAVRAGLITDLHYADKAPAGSRHYRESLRKLAEASERFTKSKPQFVVELGDLIDAADSVKVEQGYLKRIHKDFSALPGKKHCVLGNHCVTTLTKQEFLDGVQQKKSFYSFDSGGFHFVILDACFRNDGTPYGRKNFQWTDPNIPADQVEWLKSDLQKTTRKTVVFVHQRLDVGSPYGIKNAAAVRKVLEASGKVLAVFQGHSHKNSLNTIKGIPYCVVVAMVEGSGAANNGYAMMDIDRAGNIRVDGFRKQKPYKWG